MSAPRIGFLSLGCAKDSQCKPLQEPIKALPKWYLVPVN